MSRTSRAARATPWAAWLAELTECGLLRGSFIPPPQIAAIRELTRYRKKLIEQRTSEFQRLATRRTAE
ncbi:hypothetical protein GCM10009609_18340 [Pseudonocardia aurantiaca]